MKEMNAFLKYLCCYEYNFDSEEIVFTDNPEAERAIELYNNFIDEYLKPSPGDEKIDSINQKWYFDIALDTFKHIREADLNEILRAQEIFNFHSGVGLFVRNTYVYSSKLHLYFMADDVSGSVYPYMLGIIHPFYNPFQNEFRQLWGDWDFERLRKQYGKKYAMIDEVAIKMATGESELTCEKAKSILFSMIRELEGRIKFKQYYINLIHSNRHPRTKRVTLTWLDYQNKLYDESLIFMDEYHQIVKFGNDGLLQKIENHEIEASDSAQVREYVKRNYNLSADDVEFYTCCISEAYS